VDEHELHCHYIVVANSVKKVDISVAFGMIREMQKYDWAEFKDVSVPDNGKPKTSPKGRKLLF